MSTRCQVQVVQEGLEWEQKVTLYHHTDGYPTYMLPLLAKARGLTAEDWRAGRAGKAASFLCAADPGVFEPEDSHEPHGDIEWFYRLIVGNSTGGSTAEKSDWQVEVYSTGFDLVEFPTGGERLALTDAVERADELEAATAG